MIRECRDSFEASNLVRWSLIKINTLCRCWVNLLSVSEHWRAVKSFSDLGAASSSVGRRMGGAQPGSCMERENLSYPAVVASFNGFKVVLLVSVPPLRYAHRKGRFGSDPVLADVSQRRWLSEVELTSRPRKRT